MGRRSGHGRHRHSGRVHREAPRAGLEAHPAEPRPEVGRLPGALTIPSPGAAPLPAAPAPLISTADDSGSDTTADPPFPAADDRAVSPVSSRVGHDGNPADGGCTAPQLRRFIKSRAYVPMHELRRRFNLNGAEDEVSPLEVDGSRIYVGLPPRESRLLGELLRGGDVGFELSVDPVSPIVIGVYPMRPVPRV
jgi:hypothetical protein